MSTQILYLTGTAKWAKLYPGQEDTKFGKKNTIDLYPDEESMIVFKTSGSRTKVRQSEEGEYIKLDREPDKEIGKSGHHLGPPEVVEPNPDTTAEEKTIPFTKQIGNGSQIVCKVEVYDSTYGKGTRLAGVSVIKHVEFAGTEVANPDNPYAF